MMTDEKCLLAQIEAFCAASGMSESTFGRLAVSEWKFTTTLRGGRRCWPHTIEKVRAFMDKSRREQVEKARAGK